MTYAVRHGGKYSAAFKSAIGVLTGDSASPGLWNIFFADLFFPSDPDDVVLDGIPVSHACRTSRQCCPLLNLRGRCPTSCGCLLRVVPHQFHGLSVLKTQWMLFGPLPNIVPRIYVACPHRFRTRVQVRWGVVCLHHAPEFLPCSCIKSARRLGNWLHILRDGGLCEGALSHESWSMTTGFLPDALLLGVPLKSQKCVSS
jgi:hypothetical protein